MADSNTPNHGFVLPEINFSKNTWGTKLNGNWSALDAMLNPTTGLFLARAGGSMTGALSLAGNPTVAAHAANKAYVDAAAGNRYTKAESDARFVGLAGGAMTGLLSLSGNPTAAAHAANKAYVDAQIATRLTQTAADARYLQLAGGTLTGQLALAGNPTADAHAASKAYVDAQIATRLTQAAGDARYLQLAGGTMAGQLSLVGDPTLAAHAARKAYVDAQIATRLTQAAADNRYALKGVTNTFNASQVITGSLMIDPPQGSTFSTLYLRDALDRLMGMFYSSSDSSQTIIRSYGTPGGDYFSFYFDGSNGRFTATQLAGNGSAISSLNAGALASGTVPEDRLPSTVAKTGTTITGGNGLSGSGSLGASNITISLGTPSGIGPDSTNSVTAKSHTHALPAGTVGAKMADLSTGAIGTSSTMRVVSGSDVGPGGTVAGSVLRYATTGGDYHTAIPAGRWRCDGYALVGSALHGVSTFRRIE